MQKLVVSTVPPIKIFAALVSILPANRGPSDRNNEIKYFTNPKTYQLSGFARIENEGSVPVIAVPDCSPKRVPPPVEEEIRDMAEPTSQGHLREQHTVGIGICAMQASLLQEFYFHQTADRIAKAPQNSSKALAWYLRSTGIRQINSLNQVPFAVYIVSVCEAQDRLSVLCHRFNTLTDVIGSHYIIMAKPH